MKNRFYLASLRDTVGSNMAFHSTKGGYTTDLDQAKELTLAEAQRAWDSGRDFDLPVSADHADSLALLKVDFQYLDKHFSPEQGEPYVAYLQGRWDGNDLFFLSSQEDRLATTNFQEVAHLSGFEAQSLPKHYTAIPFAQADAVKRRTFDLAKLNRRTMIQGAGLVTPEHIKRFRKRRPSNKTRWNCPACGKIHWQLHPYEFEGCNDPSCSESHQTSNS